MAVNARFRSCAYLLLVASSLMASTVRDKTDTLIARLPLVTDPRQRLELLSAIVAGHDPDGRYAQATIRLADSLIAHGHAHDTLVLVAKGDALWQYGFNRFDGNPGRNVDSAFAYYLKATEAYRASGDARSIAFASANISQFYINQGDARQALRLLKEALPVHEQRHNVAMLIKDHGGLGRAYYVLGDLSRSLDHQQIALRYALEKSSYPDIGAIEHNIGNLYQDEGQLDTAAAYYQRAISAFRKGDEADGRWLVSLYNLVICRSGQSDIAEARQLVNEGLASLNGEQLPWQACLVHIADAELLRDKGDAQGALRSSAEGLRLARAAGDQRSMVPALISSANAHLALSNTEQALELAREAQGLCDSLDVALSQERDVAQLLSDLYTATGPPEEALRFTRLYHLLDDSVRNEPTRKKLAAIDLRKQELADSLAAAAGTARLEEEHQQELASEQRRRTWSWVGAGLLAVVAVLLIVRLQYARKARASSEGIVEQLLPKHVSEELRTKGHITSREVPEVTVLFTDFIGFTQLAQRVPAKELHEEMDVCFAAFDRLVQNEGGERIKTIGDAYMAAIGLNEHYPDAASRLVRAALNMQHFLHERERVRAQDGLFFFTMRAGLHTGPVIAGVAGAGRLQYDIWGDTVNTASRMESSGEVGKVNISAVTHDRLQQASGAANYAFTPRGKVLAKGIGDMEMYFVDATVR